MAYVHLSEARTRAAELPDPPASLSARRNPVCLTTLQRATRSLYHRGPDGQRYWISPDSRVALGHARLSIIDLTTGD